MIDKTKKLKRFSFLVLLFLFLLPSLAFASPEYSSIDVSTPIFLILGISSILFLFAGIFAKSPLLSVIGVLGILICGFLMLQGHILVPTGEIHNTTGNVTTISTTYDNWDGGNNELFGFFIIIACAGLGFTLLSEYSED